MQSVCHGDIIVCKNDDSKYINISSERVIGFPRRYAENRLRTVVLRIIIVTIVVIVDIVNISVHTGAREKLDTPEVLLSGSR